jgi:hypothetical protein
MLILYIVNTENIIRIIGLDLLTLHSIQQQKKKIFLKTLKVSRFCLVSGTNVSWIGAKLCSNVTATCRR